MKQRKNHSGNFSKRRKGKEKKKKNGDEDDQKGLFLG